MTVSLHIAYINDLKKGVGARMQYFLKSTGFDQESFVRFGHRLLHGYPGENERIDAIVSMTKIYREHWFLDKLCKNNLVVEPGGLMLRLGPKILDTCLLDRRPYPGSPEYRGWSAASVISHLFCAPHLQRSERLTTAMLKDAEKDLITAYLFACRAVSQQQWKVDDTYAKECTEAYEEWAEDTAGSFSKACSPWLGVFVYIKKWAALQRNSAVLDPDLYPGNVVWNWIAGQGLSLLEYAWDPSCYKQFLHTHEVPLQNVLTKEEFKQYKELGYIPNWSGVSALFPAVDIEQFVQREAQDFYQKKIKPHRGLFAAEALGVYLSATALDIAVRKGISSAAALCWQHV